MIGSGRTAQRETVLGQGVDAFLDLQQDRLEDVGEVDVVFDVIGGEILDRSAQLVRAGGALVTIAEPPRVQPRDARAIFFVVEPDRARLAGLERRLRDGRLLVRLVGAVVPTRPTHLSAFEPGLLESRQDDHPGCRRRTRRHDPALTVGDATAVSGAVGGVT